MAKRTRRGWGNISKLPSGRHRARYVGPDGKLHNAPTTYTRRSDAAAWLDKERELIDRGTWTPPEGRGPAWTVHTLHETYRRFIEQRNTPLALSTLDGYEREWRLRIEPHWGAGRDVATIRHEEVWDWRRGPLAGEGRRDRAALELFATLLARAARWGWIDRNPAEGITISKKPVNAQDRHVFTPTQVRTYLEAAEPHHRALLACVALGGLRSGEVRALRRCDLDLDGLRLHVRQAVGFGRRDGQWVTELKPPKTTAGVRTLPMSKLLAGILRDHLTRHPRVGEALVFTNTKGQVMGPTFPDQCHAKALSNMGLRTSEAEKRRLRRRGVTPPRENTIRLHDLRASYATWLFLEGYGVAEVMAWLGWSKAEMALEVYSRVFPGRMDEARAAQDAAFAGMRLEVQ